MINRIEIQVLYHDLEVLWNSTTGNLLNFPLLVCISITSFFSPIRLPQYWTPSSHCHTTLWFTLLSAWTGQQLFTLSTLFRSLVPRNPRQTSRSGLWDSVLALDSDFLQAFLMALSHDNSEVTCVGVFLSRLNVLQDQRSFITLFVISHQQFVMSVNVLQTQENGMLAPGSLSMPTTTGLAQVLISHLKQRKGLPASDLFPPHHPLKSWQIGLLRHKYYTCTILHLLDSEMLWALNEQNN